MRINQPIPINDSIKCANPNCKHLESQHRFEMCYGDLVSGKSCKCSKFIKSVPNVIDVLNKQI